MFDSLRMLMYRIGLYFPGSEKRLVRHLKRGVYR